MPCEKDLCIAKKICASRKKFVNRGKVLSIAKKFCASRKRFVNCEKDLSIAKKICRLRIAKKICRLRKRFVDCGKDLPIVKKFCASRKRFVDCEKDLSSAKKICQSRKRFVDRVLTYFCVLHLWASVVIDLSEELNKVAFSLNPLSSGDGFTIFLRTFINTLNKHASIRKKKQKRSFIFDLFSCIFIFLSRESDQSAIRARLGVASHVSTTPRWGNPAKCLSQRHNK